MRTAEFNWVKGRLKISLDFPRIKKEIRWAKANLSGFDDDGERFEAHPTRSNFKALKAKGFVVKGVGLVKRPDTIKDVPGLPHKLYGYQLEDLNWIEHCNGRALVADDMGLGKAQPLDAKILTPTGWTTMGMIKVGDLVIKRNGETTAIKRVFPQGIQKTYRVHFSDGSSTECNGEHLWAVTTPCRKRRRSGPLVLTTYEIMSRGLKHKNGNRKFFIPLVKPVQFSEKELPIDPYVLGLILGNGGLSAGRVGYSTADKQTIKDISSSLPDTCQIRYDRQYDYSITRIAKSGPNPFMNKLRELKLMRGKSEHKFIPKTYLLSSVEQRTRLLQGLMDTDGSCFKDGTSQFYTSSPRLSKDFIELVRSLGGIATHNIKKTYRLDCNVHTVAFAGNIIPFKLNRKRDRYKTRCKYQPTRSIEKIEYVGKKEQQCIAIDAKNGLYVTDDYIVTHNTPTSLAWCHLHPEKRPILIVCPAFLKYVWKREIKKWNIQGKVCVLSSKTTCKPYGDIHIINYDILGAWQDVLLKQNYQILIIDEVHAIKSSKSKRSKALKVIGKKIPHIIAMSGTPIVNRPIEFYNTLKLLIPNQFPTKMMFGLRYCHARLTPWGWDFNGSSNEKELNEILTSCVMIRHEKGRVDWELPEKTHNVIPLEIKNRTKYKQVESKTVNWLDEHATERQKKLVGLAKVEKLKQLAVAGKMADVFAWIDNFLAQNDKLIIMAWHKSVITELMNRYKNCAVRFDGSMSNELKLKAERCFNRDKHIKLFVGNIKAAGVGIDLTAAADIAFIEFPWNPGELNQAIDRIYRHNQTKRTNVWFLIAENTIESDLIKMIDGKAKNLSHILNGRKVNEKLLISHLLSTLKRRASNDPRPNRRSGK